VARRSDADGDDQKRQADATKDQRAVIASVTIGRAAAIGTHDTWARLAVKRKRIVIVYGHFQVQISSLQLKPISWPSSASRIPAAHVSPLLSLQSPDRFWQFSGNLAAHQA